MILYLTYFMLTVEGRGGEGKEGRLNDKDECNGRIVYQEI